MFLMLLRLKKSRNLLSSLGKAPLASCGLDEYDPKGVFGNEKLAWLVGLPEPDPSLDSLKDLDLVGIHQCRVGSLTFP
jgi:hypothetical protein